ncbi:hypothetical protein KIKIMORA_05080 [Brevundimonas phage vB_BpoS-Kikimora]|uniref:Uncharacterized protein n=1 Tax=Brevundimonas phage vB_BpoS-Kikimora TaxID=2948601 RepID=A0A9E7SLB0_9CAUD|nr:hypothetical protein KIKIMORA_05080 [Brevundimonas phage vB_BpoS-Kikimora]
MTDAVTYPPLRDPARAALEAFATKYAGAAGGWKTALCAVWAEARESDEDDAAALRLIRNRYGPSWLLEVYGYGWTPDLPQWEALEWDADGRPVETQSLLPRWGGEEPPPAVGSEVEANFNNLGRAVVTGYFTEGGFLGLIVRFVDPPAYLTKQNKGDVIGHLFGPEIYSQAECEVMMGGYQFRRRAAFLEGRFDVHAFHGAPSLTPDEIAARHEAIKAGLIARAAQHEGPFVVFDPNADEDGWLIVGDRQEIAAETAQMIADTRD